MHLQPQHERGGHSAAAAQQHCVRLVQPRAAHVERRAGEEAGVVDPTPQRGVRRGFRAACLTGFAQVAYGSSVRRPCFCLRNLNL